jgi:hypothetical protein
MKNRKREICTSGTVRDEDGNVLIYSANDRGDRGNVGIIRSPIRASILPDRSRLWRQVLSTPEVGSYDISCSERSYLPVNSPEDARQRGMS